MAERNSSVVHFRDQNVEIVCGSCDMDFPSTCGPPFHLHSPLKYSRYRYIALEAERPLASCCDWTTILNVHYFLRPERCVVHHPLHIYLYIACMYVCPLYFGSEWKWENVDRDTDNLQVSQ